MAGANPTETHHLLQRSTLRQRVVTSCHHEGHHHGDAGTLALINTMSIFSFISKYTHFHRDFVFAPCVTTSLETGLRFKDEDDYEYEIFQF